VKEAKAVMDMMFDKLSKDASLQRRGLENKIKAQDKQIESLKRLLSSYGNHQSSSETVSANQSNNPTEPSKKRKQSDADLTMDESMVDMNTSAIIYESKAPSAIPKPRRNSVLTTGPHASARPFGGGTTAMNRLPLRVLPNTNANKKMRVLSADEKSSRSSSVMTAAKPPLHSSSKAMAAINKMLDSTKASLSTIKPNLPSVKQPVKTKKDVPHVSITVHENVEDSEHEVEIDEEAEVMDVEGADDDSVMDETFDLEEESYEEDESFRPDDESFEDEDDEGDGYPRRPRLKAKSHQSKQHHHQTWKDTNIEAWVSRPSENSFSSHESSSNHHTWHRNSGQSSGSSDRLGEDLAQYTVKELKSMLSERGLPVSGVKDVLIQRLKDYMIAHHESDISLNSSTIDLSMDEMIDGSHAKDNENENDENLVPQTQQLQTTAENPMPEKKHKLNTNRKMMFGAATQILNELDEMVQGM
jgi:hypothetical protein